MAAARNPPRRRWRELWARLLAEHSGPLRLGLAVGLGIVIGCSPFFGLHLWIGLGLAVLLRLNKVAVFFGAQISIPPLAPVIGFASVQLGALILQGHPLHLAPADFALARLPTLLRSFFLAWLLGGLLLGLALAAPTSLLIAALVRWRRVSPADRAWREHTAALRRAFSGAPRGHRGYVTGKLMMDPVYRQICEELGQLERALDLGTGLGLLPLLLAVRGQAAELIGLDWDEAKLQSARIAAQSLPAGATRNLRFEPGDLRTAVLPEADAVFLLDVLHYYPPAEQRQILAPRRRCGPAASSSCARPTARRARS